MNNRLLFNLVVGAVFVAVYFVSTSVLNVMASSGENSNHAHSFERRTADAHVNNGDLKAAARYYKELIRSDPFNASAHAYYAGCVRVQIERILMDSAANRDELDSLVVEAKQAYAKCLPFKKCRNRARLYLAFLNGHEGNNEEAIKLLLQAMDDRVARDHFRKRCRIYGCEDLLKNREIARYFY